MFVEKHPHPSPITRMLVMGISDGTIGMVVLITSLSALHATSELIIITGLAYMLSGVISMTITTYLFLNSEKQTLQDDIDREGLEIETEPEEEKQELRDIFKQEGYSAEASERLLTAITKDKDTWLRAQLKFELNKAIESATSPIKHDIMGVGIGFSVSSLALLPFALKVPDAALIGLMVGAVVLFITSSTNLSWRFNSLKHGVKVTALVIAVVVFLYLTVHLTGVGFS